MTRSPTSRWPGLLLVAPFAGILMVNARHYFPFLSDDALISLRYARRMLAGHGLSWTDGRPVEGYSNLLWVLLVAVPGFFGLDLIVAARALGILSTLVVLASLGLWYGRVPLRRAWFPVVAGLLFLSLSAPMAVWSIGGLEQPLYGALIALALPPLFVALESREAPRLTLTGLSVVLALLCLTRPDGPIFTVVAAATLAARWRSLAPAGRVVALPLLAYAAQLVFRVWYYGAFVPNTALVKIAPTRARWIFGWEYLSGGLSALSPFSYLAIAAMVVLLVPTYPRWRAVALAAMAGAWSAYLVFIGGDIFPAYRHFVPLVVIFAFALAEGAVEIAERLRGRPLYLSSIALITIALYVPFAQRQVADKHSVRAVRERWEWQGKEVALLLKRAFHVQQPLLAVTAAGSLPYWSELPALDMLGLNDYYLPRHPPPDMGMGFLGHELGDARYVLERKPDIIVFTVGSPPEFRAGQQLAATPEFHARYVPVMVRTRPLEYLALIYFNRYSTKLGMGIINADTSVTVPGFLFTAKDAVAQLNAAGKLVASISSGQTLRLAFITDATLAGAVVEVRSPDPAGITADLQQHGKDVTITLRSTSGAAVEIEEVVVRKP